MRKLLHMPMPRRLLLARALCLVATTRLVLLVLPFRVLRSGLARIHPARTPIQNYSAEEIAWAVTAVSRFVPRATCLTQALAVQVMLARVGEGSRLCIGVNRGESGAFESHAWVVHNGRIVIGGAVSERYVPLWDLEMRSP